MRGYITMRQPRIFSAPLHIHWSAFVAAGVSFGVMLHEPLSAVLAVSSYFGVIVLHEAGHAYVAKRLGHRPINIYVSILHGVCEFERPDEVKEEAMIAWGGVLAQLAVAIPIIILNRMTPIAALPSIGIVISLLGYFNLAIAMFNLIPLRGLDGAAAWRLIPILLRERRQKYTSQKSAKEFLQRFK